MSTFEDAIEDQILRAELIETLETEQRADADALARARRIGSRWQVAVVRVRMWFRERQIRALT